jgi:Tol biopolymer transport system component
LTWFDRSGKSLGPLGARDENSLTEPEISSDGHRVAVYREVQGITAIWILDDGGRLSRFTSGPRDIWPTWSRDDTQIAFGRSTNGIVDLYQKASSGTGSEALVLKSPQTKSPYGWSHDGRSFLFSTLDPRTALDLWLLPADRTQKSIPILNSVASERYTQFSPDDRWIVYVSDESGRNEVYAKAFPGPGNAFLVSTMGGVAPRWRRDGKELYYISPDAKMLAVSVAVNGSTFVPGPPTVLFQTRIAFGGAAPAGIRWQYDVAPDGRFLVNEDISDGGAGPITVIQNWNPESKR